MGTQKIYLSIFKFEEGIMNDKERLEFEERLKTDLRLKKEYEKFKKVKEKESVNSQKERIKKDKKLVAYIEKGFKKTHKRKL